MITPKDVHYIAHLARIPLDESQVAKLQKDLEGILHYIDKLKKLDTTNVEPTSHAIAISNVLRDDVVEESLKLDDFLRLAPQSHRGSFKVPKVLE